MAISREGALDWPLRRVFAKREVDIFTARGLHTLSDLMHWVPRTYLSSVPIERHFEDGERVHLVADVVSSREVPMRSRKGSLLKVLVDAGNQKFELTFFQTRPHKFILSPGRRALFAGKVAAFNGRWQLAQPEYVLLSSNGVDDQTIETLAESPLIPIYRRMGTKLGSWGIAKAVIVALDSLWAVADPVQELAARHELPPLYETFRLVHRPVDLDEPQIGRRRLKYDEALAIQVVLAMRRAATSGDAAVARAGAVGGVLDAFDARLPFRLTEGQVETGEVLAEELARDRPMHRLLQGEVGSGKTVVALRAMLHVVDSGGQAALLAPTEVLAQQHYRTITAMLGDLAMGGMLGGNDIGTRVALVTGSQSAADKRRNLALATSGEAGIVIGTHALLQDKVAFADLALVVVDEQHRFGVEQRDVLRGKAARVPHTLVMTATPIPRTVAITAFGDLDTSTLSQLPSGRAEIKTFVVPATRPTWVQRVWERMAEEVAAGRQVYVVCPRVGDGSSGDDLTYWERAQAKQQAEEARARGDQVNPDDEDEKATAARLAEEARLRRAAASVVDTDAMLAEVPVLKGLRRAVLHGRLPAEERERIMTSFAAGEIDILVATTVIEVGVDVPNASLMVVLDADRFGISQLHQLRGRIGRGEHPSSCFLVCLADEGTPTRDRLEAVAATTDGFELAEVDLDQRGEGDVLGALQSGRSGGLALLRLREDSDLIELAREDARGLVDADPTLEGSPELLRYLRTYVDDQQADFVERG
ncbi:ATP-dependent DNA helicase RecG [Arsenicicoccus piscis]|uniref:ATP-dependent DNA helicase RecG n=1 Tax=Arsenicicoccus piscis TaxID=673954 RepID=UPI001F4CA09B|nr:ATP-dependent DNA helicase RecG [Arsenicicoccus piscis]MCH8626897.1 ATP-dependent DNA helicase RecG [Arsenicicoccus piscis]